jgi:hypothetical protein
MAHDVGVVDAVGALVRAELGRRTLQYAEDGTTIYVPFAGADSLQFSLVCDVTAGEQPGLAIAAVHAEPVARAAWPAALYACNSWNARSTPVTVHLRADDWIAGEHAVLVARSWLPTPDAPSAQQVGATLDAVLFACARLWVEPVDAAREPTGD